ncbi:MAG: hypothetical protein KA104_01945 [Candidatus Pacebacteria bacterium]|nr:hypothetical protein [Candidatus Paceibacterota bacterium]
MSGVSFNEESQYKNAVAPKRSVFMKLAYATGIPENDVQAQYVLLGVAGLCVLVGIGIFVFGNLSKPTPLTPEDPAWPKPAPTYEQDI